MSDRNVLWELISEERLIETASGCIGCKSEVPTGSDMEMSVYVYEFLKALGFTPWKQECGDGRFNVLVRIPGKGSREIMYCGHLDVVPACGEGWISPPYEPEVRSGKLYGRGASDMKGSLACMLYLAELAAAGRIVPRENLLLFFDVDEENHNLGLKTFLQSPELPDFIIVGEPTSLQLAMGHRGVMAFTIKIMGRSAHAARPDYGNNPIRAAMLLQQRVIQMQERLWNREVKYQGRSSMELTMIMAGDKVNMIPGECEVRIDRRLTQGEEETEAADELRKLLNEVERETGCRCEMEVTTCCPPGLCGESHEMIRRMMRTILACTGQEAKMKAFEASGEAGMLTRYLNVPAVTFGPGDIRQAHTVNEYITVEQLVMGAKIYGDLLFVPVLEGK